MLPEETQPEYGKWEKIMITAIYTCRGETSPGFECEHEFEVTITVGAPARMHGHPDNWCPADDDDVEPGECPECGTEVDEDWVDEQIKEGRDE